MELSIAVDMADDSTSVLDAACDVSVEEIMALELLSIALEKADE